MALTILDLKELKLFSRPKISTIFRNQPSFSLFEGLRLFNNQVAVNNNLLAGNEVLLGSKKVNMNITTDQAITINKADTSRAFIVTRIVVTNASTSLTTAAGGVYNTASKGGTALVAAGQAYSTLTVAARTLNLTLVSPVLTQTAASLFLSLTTAQGAAATADVYVYGILVPVAAV